MASNSDVSLGVLNIIWNGRTHLDVAEYEPARAQAAAVKFGVPHAFAQYEELLNSGQVDAVSIASPIGFHYDQGKRAIAQGIHLHFNKTMTTTVSPSVGSFVGLLATDKWKGDQSWPAMTLPVLML